jgi:hypothetical protein
LAIAGANYTRRETERRLEMLRVAHKFVLATSFFILFVLAYFFLTVFTETIGQVNPNSLAWGKQEVYGGVLFWLSGISLFIGPFLFVLGSGELLSALVKLRRATHLSP